MAKKKKQLGGYVYPVNYVPQKKDGGWLDEFDVPEAQVGEKIKDYVKKPVKGIEKKLLDEYVYPAVKESFKTAKAQGLSGEHNGPLDAIRHATSAATVSSILPSWMNFIPQVGIANFVGSNLLGAAHELTSPNPIREIKSDVYNNLIGSGIGMLPLSDSQKRKLIIDAQKKGILSTLESKQDGGGVESTMGGLTDKGFNYNGAWGGPSMENGGITKAQIGKNLLPVSPSILNFGIKAIDKLSNLVSSPSSKISNESAGFPETIEIKDPRKVRKTTGKPINPNVDLVSGKYDTFLIKEALEDAKKYGLSKEDAWNLAAIGFQESGWGRTDNNIGHISDGSIGTGDTENVFINAYLNKMREADRLKITDPEMRLQVYNGLGLIKPETEQNYHKFKMKKIYGVPVPKEGLSMKKNPLYGKQVIDIRDNVLRQNPEVVKYIESLYEEAPNKEMGGSIPGSVGFTYARTEDPAPSKGKYAKKTMASAQNGQEMKFYQEGLDWKPRNISRDGSEIPQAQLGLHMLTPDYSQVGENIMEMLSVPQKALTKLFSGKYQTPSEAMNIKNPVGAFAVDAILDPINLMGAGAVAKASTETGALSKAYKYNPWAFKPNEENWYRQVGKSAIDDAFETRTIREPREEVSPRMWSEFQDQIKRLEGDDALSYEEKYKQQILASRRPASPFFAKGELFYPMGRKETITKSGKLSKNPAAKGNADYLIETTLPNESFQPAYVKGMSPGVPTTIGQTAILKPNPSLRDLENFNLYKQHWLQGYKKVKPPKKKEEGGEITKDDNGYWNPDNWGEPVEIGSNEITMQGVYEPLLGISDTGDVQMMYPGEDYTFNGKQKVTEYPVTNWLDEFE